MKAMVITKEIDLNYNKNPLELTNIPDPTPVDNEIIVKIISCGVCHTEIDEIEGRAKPEFYPIIPGHQIIGKVIEKGKFVKKHKIDDLVGIGWIYSSCGKCEYCINDLENLCSEFKGTGMDENGGYAEYIKINEDFAISVPENFNVAPEFISPLLCAGAIGYRAIKLSKINNNSILGLSGFGGSNHLVLKLVKYLYSDTKIFVFARNENERKFALELGADWAGDFSDNPPKLIDSIIDTTPVWSPIVNLMDKLKPGGIFIINAIRKEDNDKNNLQNINYPTHLWKEKEIKSIANVTRNDISECLKICANARIIPEIQTYKLEEANKALVELKERKIKGSKVLIIE